MVDITTTTYKSKFSICSVLAAFSFLFVYDMRINLRGFDVSMSHQRLDGVYVNAIFQQQRSIAMPPTMEGDVLLGYRMLLSRLSTGEKSKRHQSILQKQVLHHRLDVCRIVEVPVE